MKRRLSLFTAVMMLVFSLSAFAEGFSDMPAADSQYYTAFEYAVNNKIISGVDGKLLPDNSVTLAEAVTFISRAKPFTNGNADLSMVSDVTSDAWYYTPLSQAVAAGIITVVDGKLNPTSQLTRRNAWDMLYKLFGNQGSYTPISDGDKLATRGDFILWLYNYVKPQAGQNTEPATENSSETPTQAPTEFTDLKAQMAQEAMQVALGIRADGSSYVAVTVYKDASQEDWGQGSGGSSSSRPSGGSNPTRPTESPDDDETQAPTDNETQAPDENETQAPTEPETDEPTYGEYDGPIDNDKDNVIDDPFDDGWVSNPTGGGSGGYDEEEEDFTVNDELEPEDSESSEEETQAPTEDESESETETEPESESETVPESDTEPESDSEPESDTEPESDSEPESDTEPESDSADEPQEDAGDAENGTDSSLGESNTDNFTEAFALFFSKDWWFN